MMMFTIAVSNRPTKVHTCAGADETGEPAEGAEALELAAPEDGTPFEQWLSEHKVYIVVVERQRPDNQ
jgi:hypothetical protein